MLIRAIVDGKFCSVEFYGGMNDFKFLVGASGNPEEDKNIANRIWWANLNQPREGVEIQ
jgi:hypothetical protein